MAIISLHFDVAAVKLEDVMKVSVENPTKAAQKGHKKSLNREFTGNLGSGKSNGEYTFLFCLYDLISQNLIVFLTASNTMPFTILFFLRVSLRTNSNLEKP